MTFDLGGVDFNGLEMLQGFTGADVASFWNTLNVDPPYATSSHGQPMSRQVSIPGQHTPQSASGSVTGPRPSAWTYQSPPTGMDHTGVGADFWSQVAGGSFNWAADPSVPFKI